MPGMSSRGGSALPVVRKNPADSSAPCCLSDDGPAAQPTGGADAGLKTLRATDPDLDPDRDPDPDLAAASPLSSPTTTSILTDLWLLRLSADPDERRSLGAAERGLGGEEGEEEEGGGPGELP